MQLNLTGHHIDLTDALRAYAEEKLGKLERFFDKVGNVHVVLSVEKNRQKAEATMHVNGADLFANAEDENMYAAIDALSDKLHRQLKKHKEKTTSHHP